MRGLFLTVLLCAAPGGVARATPPLSILTDAGTPVRCLAEQFREGSDEYRRCVSENGDGVAESASGSPSFDERYAVAQACAAAEAPRACAEAQRASLAGAPLSRLDLLGADDRNAILRQCFGVQGREGLAAWGRCLDEAIAAVAALPELPTDTASLPERSAVAQTCATEGDTAAAYRRCRLQALGVVADVMADTADDEKIVASVPLATRRVTLPAEPDLDGVDSDRDVTAQTEPDVGAAEPTDVPVDTSADASADTDGPADGMSGIAERADGAREWLLATIGDLDRTERTVMLTALALPLLLFGLWALERKSARHVREEVESDEPLRNPSLVNRVAPSMHRAGEASHPEADYPEAGHPDSGHPDYGDGASDDEFFADIRNATGGAPAAGRHGRVARDRTDAFDDGAAPAGDAFGTAARDDGDDAFVPRSAFGSWLTRCDPDVRRQYAIEFLIYWMAYGDERYEPALAEALLAGTADDDDPQDAIKRYVLRKDIAAFADVVRWVQTHCGELERVQIIDLLMVLLVGDGAMTPVQNTLLHFLADALGLGPDGLEQRHEEAFGQPMPALARVDLPVWWKQLDPAAPSLWEARDVARLGDRDQQRVRLGLPLDGELEDSRIVEAFRRAARRCHPHRFDALGERERALAERQSAKFEGARDRLLGVGA